MYYNFISVFNGFKPIFFFLFPSSPSLGNMRLSGGLSSVFILMFKILSFLFFYLCTLNVTAFVSPFGASANAFFLMLSALIPKAPKTPKVPKVPKVSKVPKVPKALEPNESDGKTGLTKAGTVINFYGPSPLDNQGTSLPLSEEPKKDLALSSQELKSLTDKISNFLDKATLKGDNNIEQGFMHGLGLEEPIRPSKPLTLNKRFWALDFNLRPKGDFKTFIYYALILLLLVILFLLFLWLSTALKWDPTFKPILGEQSFPGSFWEFLGNAPSYFIKWFNPAAPVEVIPEKPLEVVPSPKPIGVLGSFLSYVENMAQQIKAQAGTMGIDKNINANTSWIDYLLNGAAITLFFIQNNFIAGLQFSMFILQKAFVGISYFLFNFYPLVIMIGGSCLLWFISKTYGFFATSLFICKQIGNFLRYIATKIGGVLFAAIKGLFTGGILFGKAFLGLDAPDIIQDAAALPEQPLIIAQEAQAAPERPVIVALEVRAERERPLMVAQEMQTIPQMVAQEVQTVPLMVAQETQVVPELPLMVAEGIQVQPLMAAQEVQTAPEHPLMLEQATQARPEMVDLEVNTQARPEMVDLEVNTQARPEMVDLEVNTAAMPDPIGVTFIVAPDTIAVNLVVREPALTPSVVVDAAWRHGYSAGINANSVNSHRISDGDFSMSSADVTPRVSGGGNAAPSRGFAADYVGLNDSSSMPGQLTESEIATIASLSMVTIGGALGVVAVINQLQAGDAHGVIGVVNLLSKILSNPARAGFSTQRAIDIMRLIASSCVELDSSSISTATSSANCESDLAEALSSFIQEQPQVFLNQPELITASQIGNLHVAIPTTFFPDLLGALRTLGRRL